MKAADFYPGGACWSLLVAETQHRNAVGALEIEWIYLSVNAVCRDWFIGFKK